MAGRAGLSRHPGRPVPPARPPAPGASFAYVFDLGEDWTHLCTARRADDRWQAASRTPYPLHGWGVVPDQYGRTLPAAPAGSSRRAAAVRADLPPILASWGACR